MDRLSEGLDQGKVTKADGENPALTLNLSDEELVRKKALNSGVPDELYRLNELDVLYETDIQTLWTYMRPAGRPSFTRTMLKDFSDWQRLIVDGFGPEKVPLRYLVLGSRAPGVFCFGGDLELFRQLILDRNEQGLRDYGYRCVEILDRNTRSLSLPILTIGLVQGAALGGGFEALLSFDYVVAERGSTFGLPEILFGLFPGMGAHSFLSRKLGTALADRLIVSNKTYTAEQMYELGLVHVLAEPGQGLSTCRDLISKSERRHPGLVKAREAMRTASPVPLDEMKRIVDLWAETALQLRDQDLKVMERLAKAQSRLMKAA